jgi:hypothetical protein
MEQFIISSEEFATVIIQPAFQDLTPSMPYESTLFDWTPVDLKGKSSRQLMNIRRTGNILQRRDASCDLNYKKMMGSTLRKITADELYAAVKHCSHEFYQGALKDFRAKDTVFGSRILPFFQAAVRQDIVTNGYFGSLDRAANPSSEYSTTMFDGALTWIKRYIAAGVTPASQSFALTNVDMRQNPATAMAAFKACIDKQNVLMRNMPAAQKAFYCSQNLLDGVHEYYKSLGQSTPELVGMYSNGVKIYTHNGIAIYVEPTWEPILGELSGNTNAAWIMLTIRGNFSYSYDSLYGEGEDEKTALMVWYEKKELSWYYQTFLKAGAQIALPEHIVIGITAF